MNCKQLLIGVYVGLAILCSNIGLIMTKDLGYEAETNLNCNLIASSHNITPKDFIITRYDDKYIMCAAYFCSYSPRVTPLQLSVHTISNSPDNIIVHLEKKSISFRNTCGNCDVSNKTRLSKCLSCPKIEESKGIEVHVRLNNSKDHLEKSEACIWDLNFNMTIEEYSCKNGSTSVNMPLESNCSVSVLSTTSLVCVRASCYNDIMLNNDTKRFIHNFISRHRPQTCIWKLYTEPHLSYTIAYSQGIGNYLFIFEGSLLIPKWHFGTCTNETSKVTVQSLHPIYILYKNDDESLEEDAVLTVNVEEFYCPLPLFIANGNVHFLSVENLTKAIYSCKENYDLVGLKEIDCRSLREDYELPQCISLKKDKVSAFQLSGSKSNTSTIELDAFLSEATRQKANSSLLRSEEGSGLLHYDEDNSSDNEMLFNRYEFGSNFSSRNFSNSRNGTFVHPWQSDGRLILFSIPKVKERIIYIIIGVSTIVIITISIVVIVVCRNRTSRSSMCREFDTFQNPIYEKPVVSVPIPGKESDPCEEKLDPDNVNC